MNEGPGKKETLRGLIEDLHAGASPDQLKQRFKDVLKGIGAADIAQIEEELIAEGLPREEIRQLCDLHLAVFQESLEAEQTLAPPGHPIHTLMQEHDAIVKIAEELRDIAEDIDGDADPEDVATQMERIRQLEEQLKDSESHYLREENVLFPYLEKHGVTQPPAIMWMEHDEIRQTKKRLYQVIDEQPSMDRREFATQLEEATASLVDLLSSHFLKESNILFPTALRVIGEVEWQEIGRQFDEIGYCCFTPEVARTAPAETEAPTTGPEREGVVTFETGSLSREEIGAIFDTLPVDVTFVDKEDRVRYFSKPEERIFERTKAIIGRAVQQCHPEKSIHVVNEILDDFRSGRKDAADFWIDFKGRFVLIRYFAVRNADGDYLGCLEVTQDVTDAKALEGEKRLLS